MVARIYQPAKSAVSSGQARREEWVLEHEPSVPRTIEPLMGYTSANETLSQVRLRFASREEAIAYAERHGIAYQVQEPKAPRRNTISYSDNFRHNRAQPWTH